ncbi:MAG: hypothetical protein JNM00_01965 [Flavobacteriales bacterium]|nr:hypothetical protein [Flavobacteriales bacterium]
MLRKYRSLFISALVLSALSGSVGDAVSQPVWSEPVKLTRNERAELLITDDGKGFYTAVLDNTRSDVFKLSYFVLPDAHLAFQQTIEVPGGEEGKQEFSALCYQKGGGLLLFTTKMDAEKDSYDAYVTRLDQLGKAVEGPMLVHSVPSEEKTNASWFEYEFSPDSVNFLVYFNTAYKRKAGEKIRLRTYNMDFELLWRKDLELPYTEDVVQVNRCLVDNRGDAYLLSGEAPKKERSTTEDLPAREGRYVLFHYRWQENRLKEFDVSLKEKTIASMVAVIQGSGKVSLSGLYSDDFRRTVSGTFLFTINPVDDKVETAAMAAFPKEFVGEVLSQKAAEKGLMLQDFYLDHVIADPSGNLLLCAEQFFISEKITQDPVTGRQQVDYQRNHNDIIVVLLKPDGGPAWYSHIPKRQVASGQDRYNSYNIFRDEGGYSIYFNDDPDNSAYIPAPDGPEPKSYYGERNGVTTRMRMSSTGALTRSTLFNNKTLGFTLVPQLGSSIPQGMRVLAAEDSKVLKYVVVQD